jgi:hypothetical protein
MVLENKQKDTIPNGFIQDGIVSEQVWFTPDITINCYPPYTKGVRDHCWVKYELGCRPTTKEGWEQIIGMLIQTMP